MQDTALRMNSSFRSRELLLMANDNSPTNSPRVSLCLVNSAFATYSSVAMLANNLIILVTASSRLPYVNSSYFVGSYFYPFFGFLSEVS